jgi:hypothetical protein
MSIINRSRLFVVSMLLLYSPHLSAQLSLTNFIHKTLNLFIFSHHPVHYFIEEKKPQEISAFGEFSSILFLEKFYYGSVERFLTRSSKTLASANKLVNYHRPNRGGMI